MPFKKWELWRLGARNTSLRVDILHREVYLRALIEWNPQGAQPNRKLRARGYGLAGAPAAIHQTLDGRHGRWLPWDFTRQTLTPTYTLRFASGVVQTGP